MELSQPLLVKPHHRDFLAAFQGALRSIVGIGIITLPFATSKTGWLLFSVCMVFIALLNAHTMKLLVFCMHSVRRRKKVVDDSNVEISMAHIGMAAFGPPGKLLALLVLITSQTGTGVAYVAFISSNLSHLLSISRALAVLAICPLLIFQCILRSTALLTPFATIGNIFFMFAFATTIYFGVAETHIPFNELDLINWNGLAPLFGMASFSLSAHGAVMAIEQHLDPQTQKMFPDIITFSVLTALSINVTFGIAGYSFFGAETLDNIFMNLKCDPCEHNARTAAILGHVIQGCTAAMIIANYPLTMWGAMQSIEDLLISNQNMPHTMDVDPHKFGFLPLNKIFVRIGVIAVTAIMATVTNNLGFLTSVTGCLSTGMLAFVLPPLFYLKLEWDTLSKSSPWKRRLEIGANGALMIAGTVFSLLTTALVIYSMART